MGNIIQPLWEECPAFTRLLCAGYPVLWIILGAINYFSHAEITFECSWSNSVERLWLWTVFLSVFFRPFKDGFSFLMMLIEVFMAMAYCPNHEKELGSSTFALWMMLTNGVINAVWLPIMFILSKATNPGYVFMPNEGLWSFLMFSITRTSLSDPEGSTNFWGVILIPNKWYPVALIAFFSLLNMQVLWNLMAALAVGYAYPYLHLECLLPASSRVNSCERGCLRDRRSFLGGTWILATDATGPAGAQVSDLGTGLQNRAMAGSQAGGGGGTNFELFAGQGNRLGEGGGQEMQGLTRAPLPEGDEVE
mmetsp:Transcript_99514/g.276955  ORF Transcript_99514/g.276955 Transcript_99514/m.276955 type:complete len:307 (-) Transcript_99514:138-1058(-)